MSVTSFWFLVLVAAGTAVYYIIPRKFQWVELFLLSLVFYYYAGTHYTILYLVVMTLVAYLTTLVIESSRKRPDGDKTANMVTASSVVIILVIWFVVKGRGLWLPVVRRLLLVTAPAYIDTVSSVEIIAALGMGYFTLQILGYIIDCYWGNITPQKNPVKLFLFVSYFPQLTTGPISRYSQLKVLYDQHKFKYENICMGAQRILWGFFKKIVIAERVGIIVSGIVNNPLKYQGFYSWIAVLLYPLQMYTDFSGCMDIILGVSELFDIKLSENFNNPFFARNSQEFWQRWHITLGTWAKDYVLYPLLKSARMVGFGKSVKKKFGRKWGGFLQNCVGMFALWMVMGIWHSGYKYIVGVSLWYWIMLMAGNLLSPVAERVIKVLEIKTQSFSWHLFQSVRTYVIYAVGATFFLCGIQGGIRILNDCLKVFTVKGYANPWIFFNDSIWNFTLEYRDLNLIILGVVLLIIVGILREKYGYARLWVCQQSFVFRWMIWIFMLLIVVVYGEYGPSFDASDFIYQGF